MATGKRLTVLFGVLTMVAVTTLYTEPATVFETVPALARAAVSLNTPLMIAGVAALIAVAVGLQRFSRLFSFLRADDETLTDRAAERTATLDSGAAATTTPADRTDSDDENESDDRDTRGSITSLQRKGNSDSVDSFGAEYDEWLKQAMDYDRSTESRARSRSELRERLRREAVAGCRLRTNAESTAALAVVNAGTWTGAPRAAGFLASDDEKSIPIRLWLWDVLRGVDPFEAAAEETLVALKALYNDPTKRDDADPVPFVVDPETAVRSSNDDATELSDGLIGRLRTRASTVVRGGTGD